MNTPRKQVRHRYISRAIDQWLDIHFGDTSFNGRVVIGRLKNGEDMRTVSVRKLTELRQYVPLIHASQRMDYYITANTISGKQRRMDELFGLQNIVIDIDCHDDERLRSVSELVQTFIWRSKRDLWNTGVIPTPNSIVRTGRGVQLWWALVPCYGGPGYDKSRYHHEKIKNTIMDYIEIMIDEYSEELEGLSVDRRASSNPVGYFRMPCTYNTKAKCYGSLEILHTKRYDQRELTKIEPPELGGRSEGGHGETQYVPMQESDRFILRNFQSAGAIRVIQLIKLRNLRNNSVGSEMRDHFNFSVYNALRMTLEHDGAMGRLRAFNAGFKKPMTQRELENCVSAAKAIGGYKYTNAKLIEFLEVTPEEQEIIGLFPARRKRRSKPNASRDEARRMLKEDRDNQILSLQDEGYSQAETARMLGIGKNTVSRVLKRLRQAVETVVNEVIMMPIDEQNDRHHFGSKYVLLRSADDEALPYSVRDQIVGGLFPIPKNNTS